MTLNPKLQAIIKKGNTSDRAHISAIATFYCYDMLKNEDQKSDLARTLTNQLISAGMVHFFMTVLKINEQRNPGNDPSLLQTIFALAAEQVHEQLCVETDKLTNLVEVLMSEVQKEHKP